MKCNVNVASANGERPISIPVDTYLTPYTPVELEWEDDEPISKGAET